MIKLNCPSWSWKKKKTIAFLEILAELNYSFTDVNKSLKMKNENLYYLLVQLKENLSLKLLTSQRKIKYNLLTMEIKISL